MITISAVTVIINLCFAIDIQDFLIRMRDHMPRDHKRLIEAIKEKSAIRSYSK